MIDALSDGDYTKWEFYERMNCIEFLNLCVYHKIKQDEQRLRNAVQTRRNK